MKRLPGHQCRYYERGRCLYEEMLNPGYHEAFKCRALGVWERLYTEFIGRAEAFDLSEEEAGRLLAKRFAREDQGRPPCPDYAPGNGEGPGGCMNGLRGLCVRALPPCEGRCRSFILARHNDNEES